MQTHEKTGLDSEALLVRSLNCRSTMLNLRHHSLVAWQRADDLFIRVHRLSIQTFPAFERFALSAQLRRAAYSVAANIVEGFGRRHKADRLHFLNIAEASLAEVAYCVHVAWRLEYITQEMRADLEKDLNGVGAPLSGLIRSIRMSTAIATATVVACLIAGFFLAYE